MRISIQEAEGQLSELVKLAQDGEEVVLTQEGGPPVRLQRVEPPRKIYSPEEKATLIRKLQEDVRKMNLPPGPDAAHSQDFLYDEFGLPK